ncbi:glucan endo-1,3-beta-glucosidase 3-like isoform X2 [Bidens hawaiensis]|uniref:glucan endo-1,3-beta-glucosidase 3-like isoform X2 n=1 Tax=Bidens hawaiensis TaxID=980011 RepID=UPI00404A72E5
MFKTTILLLSLFFHSSSVLCQESLQILTLLHRVDSPNTSPIQTMGVAVNEDNLKDVSNTVLTAENWLRNHVLSTNITSIIVTNSLLCNDHTNQEEVAKLVANSLKNLHYSLTRWGLDREIKLTVSVSDDCLHKSHLKPVLRLLDSLNSTYSVNPTLFSDEIAKLVTSELDYANVFGVFRSETVNVILPKLKQAKTISRKLSFVDYLWSASSPPPPVVELSPAPAPASSPSHPYGFGLPPCNPYHAAPPLVGGHGGPVAAPPMVGRVAEPVAAPREELWCVAKPSVPSEKLQEALDYACGPGGADCGPIKPNGSCYSPDSVVAHASYAFNSYWQKNKKNGGVCGFEGTAMLISSDPSFLHCRFILG